MDPLSSFTALSPGSNEPSHAARRDDSEDVSSQQCSADPNAFAGLQRPHSVVVTGRSGAFSRPGGTLRLGHEVTASASQMSQPGSQFHDALLEDTQYDDDEVMPSPPEPTTTKEGEVSGSKVPLPRIDEGSGGFLSTLERRLPKTVETRDDQHQNAIEILSSDDEDDAMDSNGDDAQATFDSDPKWTDDGSRQSRVVVGGGDEEGRDSSDAQGDHSDGEFDGHYRRNSMDSIPETQTLEEYEEDGGDEGEALGQALPNTEPFAETLDEDAMEVASVVEHDARPPSPQFSATPTDEPTKSTPTSSEKRTPQFLKRKPKAKQTLSQNSAAFVDTEDQTLAELSDRIRREREQKFQDVMSLTATKQRPQAWHDESQEELTPTQPSKASPEAVAHVALKKRGKAIQAAPSELSASQERSYEFIDSSCRCGEAVCICEAAPPPTKTGNAKASSAIRNLEFAFAIPQSQDSESQLQDSLPDVDALALKTLRAAQDVQQRQPKKRAATSPSPPRHEYHDEVAEVEVTPKKARIVKDSSPSSVASTPPTSRKRGRTLFSPDAGANTYPSSRSREVTPKKATQSSKPPVVPTATAATTTPNVRTRGRILSPVPSATSKPYASRSKVVFKSARHFCLTGFTGDGLENLTKLIEDYGGKMCQEDVLFRKNNSKVVVIATPIAWRKLKFMCAVACGIPVVHPGWIHGCIKAKSVIPFDGYYVPSGCSVVTGKFECQPVRELDIFKGLRFGIPFDVGPSELDTTRKMSNLIAFILRECGAEAIQEDLKQSRDYPVDIVLADEYTPVCDYYAKKYQSSVKTFAWVTECVILQRLLEPESIKFVPRPPSGPDAGQRNELAVSSVTVPISDDVQLRLHIGELLLVDLSAEGDIDHFLLFDVCEILSIRVGATPGDTRVGSKRKQTGSSSESVKLQVGVLERRPNSPALHRNHTRIIDLAPEKVKRRVVAVSKADFDAMRYRDETIFYYAEE